MPASTTQIAIKFAEPPAGHDWLTIGPSIATSVVAILVAYLVHKLTRQREREKAVYELHEQLIDSIKEVRKAAAAGWTTQVASEREAAIHDLTWHLQRCGAQAQLISLQSSTTYFWLWEYRVKLEEPLSELRDALTLGDFSNPSRGPDLGQIASVDSAIVDFTDFVDRRLIYWAKRSSNTRYLKFRFDMSRIYLPLFWLFDFYFWPIARV